MKPPRSELEREHRRGIAVGILVALIIGLAVYPPLVFGGVVGAGLGLGLARSQGEGDEHISALVPLGVALLLGVVVAVGEPLGLAAERHRFLEAWSADGALRPALRALGAYPWAWIPQTAAIGALAAAAALTVRTRR